MNVRTKTILVLSATFISGAVMGALVSGTLRRQHLNKIFRLREPGGFVGFTEDILKPTQAQKDTVQKILFDNHQRLTELRARHMNEMSALMDSLQLRLGQVLTHEQIQSLSQFNKRMSPRERTGFTLYPRMDFLSGLLSELKDRLNLTDIQMDEVRKILYTMPYRGEGGREPWRGNPKKEFQTMQKRMDSLHAKIASILTLNQKAEFEKFKKERREEINRPYEP